MSVSRAHCNVTLFGVMLRCRPGTVQKAVFVTIPGLQRTMSGREERPKSSCCAAPGIRTSWTGPRR